VSLALTNDWFPVPGTGGTNSVQIPVDPAKANVFYRMMQP
jgi:hypothetical protein